MTGAEQNDGRRLTRRDFLSLGRKAGAQALRGDGPSVIGMGQPERPSPRTAAVDIGTPADLTVLPPGTVSTQYAGTGQFYLVRVAEGVLALDRRCPGPGCAVLWRAGLPALPADFRRGWTVGQFVCLGHGAQFDRYGEPGPSTSEVSRAMVRCAISERQGRIIVRVAGRPPAAEGAEVFQLPTGS